MKDGATKRMEKNEKRKLEGYRGDPKEAGRGWETVRKDEKCWKELMMVRGKVREVERECKGTRMENRKE